MNQEYSKTSIKEKPQHKAGYEPSKNSESYYLPPDDAYFENSSQWYTDYPKSNDKIKNFITFLKLIDERVN
ncbi:MAG TPA: hypothetical protein VN703_01720 [Candidatus Sulfopaludibacter sp.]|jgi:hypothetical protein|nr:hypothetical protein [Candidatus Sulfopaludibacter sp.]